MLSDREKRLVFFELERKELDSARAELEAALKEAVAARVSGRKRQKLEKLLARIVGKIQNLDRLIADLESALDPEVSPVKLAPPVTGQEVCHG
jgi:tetrahydromethanopterin S-methyltransferase subunit B